MIRRALPLLVALASCTPTNRPTMNPGQDCVTCHVEGGQAERLRWTAAGTIYDKPDDLNTPAVGVQGVHVQITDGAGKVLHLTTNEAGNFYTAEDLDSDAGLHILLEYLGQCEPMVEQPKPYFTYSEIDGGFDPPSLPIHGIGCNHCHTDPPPIVGTPSLPVQAPGHLHIPQWSQAPENGAIFYNCIDGGPLASN